MARHDQKGRDAKYVCASCKQEQCGLCIDVLRSVYATDALCHCRRTDHGAALQRAVERERAARRADPSQPHITCPNCAKTSYHPQDIATGYCGYCHDFTGRPIHA